MVQVTRTLVDLPDDLVRRAMELTGAPSKKTMIIRRSRSWSTGRPSLR